MKSKIKSLVLIVMLMFGNFGFSQSRISTSKSLSSAVNPLVLPELQIGVGMGEMTFCNMLKRSDKWHKGPGWNSPYLLRSELDDRGYPLASTFAANAGIIYFGQTTCRFADEYPFMKDPNAIYVVTWTGDCDVELVNNFALVSGTRADHRKVYKQTKVGMPTICLKLTAGTNYATDPMTDLAMWMPDPTNPTQSMEGQEFNPLYLNMLKSQNSGVLRYMVPTLTNQSSQINWTDRRPKSHPQQEKSAEGFTWCTNICPGTKDVITDAGVAWEYTIDLSNATNKDLWICIPHGATSDYVTKLAQLIHGDDPDHTGQVGLNPSLNVWVEYSNEIWAGGGGFMQGQWAKDMAAAAGISHGQFVARKCCDYFKIFQDVFGGTDRLRRLAALWTANGSMYDTDYLAEIQSYGATLTPTVKADMMAITTYFGNGIQNYILDSVNYADPTPARFDELFDYWESTMLGGKTSQTGRDVTSAISEQFGLWSTQYNLPIVGYEGGVGLPLTAKDSYYDGVRGSDGPGIPGSDFTISTDATTGALKVLVESGTTSAKDTSFNVIATKNVCDNVWHHIAVVLPAGKSNVSDLLFYVDGVLDPKIPFNETNFKKGRDGIISTILDKNLRIGMDAIYNFGNIFTGNIDNTCIYSRDLTSSEITGMFSGTIPTQDLVAQWTFNNNGDDASGNGHSMILLGNASYSTTIKEGSNSLLCAVQASQGQYGYAEAAEYKGIAGSNPRTIALWMKTSAKGNVIVSWGKPGVFSGEITVIGAMQCGQGDYNNSPYTDFVQNTMRHPRIKEMYKNYMGLAKGQGISTPSNYGDCGIYTKYGQWSMMDYMTNTDIAAPRYAFLRDWSFGEANINEVNSPVNNRPKFNTPEMLPIAEKGTAYDAIISFGSGDGTLSGEIINNPRLPAGLSFSNTTNAIHISGIPTETGNYYVFVRILDADNDPAYRIFTLQCVARSAGSTLIDFNELVEVSRSDNKIIEPLIYKGYKFTSSSGTALSLRGPVYWGTVYPSNMIRMGTWGQSNIIAKADGGYFDLNQFDLRQNCGQSVKITGTAANGVVLTKIINTPLDSTFTVKLDWVGVKNVKIEYCTGDNFVKIVSGSGCQTGEIDNVVVNSTVTPIHVQESNGNVLIPANKYLNNLEGAVDASWKVQSDKSILALPNTGHVNATGYINNVSPMAEYYVQFTKTGTHYIWVDGFANSSGTDNTCHIGIDGMVNFTSEGMKFTGNNEYAWTNKNGIGEVAKIEIYGIGLHKINLWMNEDGAKVKQIFITNDADTLPPSLITGFSPNFSDNVMLYPNPAKDVLNIKLNTLSHSIVVTVFDMLGKTTQISEILSSDGKFKLNTSLLKNGLYMINITDGTTNIRSKLNISR